MPGGRTPGASAIEPKEGIISLALTDSGTYWTLVWGVIISPPHAGRAERLGGLCR
jgi:hypothetical protein